MFEVSINAYKLVKYFFFLQNIYPSLPRVNLVREFFTFNVKFEVFIPVKIQVEVLWVVMLCSVVVGYQRFGGPY